MPSQADIADRAARLRAARGFRGIKQPELAAQVGVSVTTLGRWERGELDPGREKALEIAAACGVPEWFIDNGFAAPPLPDEPGLDERVEALERQVAALLKRPGGDAPAPPPDELRRPYEDPRSKPDSASGDATGQAGGSR